MCISLKTIKNYAGSGGVLLNAQQTGLESAGFFHRLKSFFNFGDAREKNRATLNAISTAVLSDPRFSSPDLQVQAQRLLDGVRTDRAIDVSQIKSLVKALKKLADPTNPAALDRRVDLHMAAVDLPSECTKYASEVVRLAKLQARQIAAAGNPVDVADIVGKAIDTLRTAIANSRGLEKRNDDERLADIAGRHLRMFAVGANHTLRSDEEVADLVRSTTEFYARAREAATDQLRDREDIGPSLRQHTYYTRAYATAAVKFMDTVGRPLTPDHFEPIEAYASEMSDLIKGMLRANPTEAQVRTVVNGVERQMRRLHITNDEGEPLFGRDDDANRALARYVGRLISLNLPDATRDAIRTNLQVDSVSGMFAQMAYVSIYQYAH